MKTKIALAVLMVLAVASGAGGIKALQIRHLIAQGKAQAAPPESVSTAEVRAESWQGTLGAIASITAVQGVTIAPEIAGIVREIAFQPGAIVAAGDLLARLDTNSEEAQLRANEAQVELAVLNVTRMRHLRAGKTVSQADLDAAESTLKQNQANADAVRAIIAKKNIRAPFAGTLGIRLINVGQYLEAGKPIVSLQSLNPVYADFSLPQQEVAQLKTGLRVRVVSDACPGQTFDGSLTAMNPDLDAATRQLSLQATLDNPNGLLRPGMFARVEVLLPEAEQVLVIPATAVLSAPYGDSVYVVESKTGPTGSGELVVRQQFIRAGRARGDLLSVRTGLKPGERVVSAGLFKLRNGMTVVENNRLVPSATAEPRPADS